ncbi:MAG: S8 family serine peptidase, partial [Candidatus Cybelea sp.]
MNALKFVAPLAAALAVAACSASNWSNAPATTGASQTVTPASTRVPEWEAKHEARNTCKQLASGISCFALLSTYRTGPLGCGSPSTCGWRPIDFQTAYDLIPSLGKGAGTIVALIELGDLPSAASDLATYRSAFGLGTALFAKYNQYGQQSHYPKSCQVFGYCGEEDLDIEMVAATCPKCTIYMIEGGSCGGTVCGLEGSEAEAVSLGATILSNSWGCHTGAYGSNCGDPNFPNYFSTPGIAYLAASGDSGYPEIEWPAALKNVLAVGGTQLQKFGSTFTETVWSGAGAGCATTITKPSWQHDSDCTGRTIADVSMQAGCAPAVAVYDSMYSGWIELC